jgi:phosphatidylglycerophosphatase A
MTRAAHFLLTAGGLGHMRPASGTWGSTPPVALALLLALLLGGDGLTLGDHVVINGALIGVAIVFSWACIAFGAQAEQRWARKDPGQVVADEVAGQCVALLALPWRGDHLLWNGAIGLGAFLAFRVMDIVKPPPANGLQKLKAGWGILVDDLVAGAYAAATIQIVTRLLLNAA